MASTFFKARLEGRALEHVVAGDTAPGIRMREESTGKWATVKTQDAKAVLQYMRISFAIYENQGEGGDGAAASQGAHLQWWRRTHHAPKRQSQFLAAGCSTQRKLHLQKQHVGTKITSGTVQCQR